MSDHEFLNVARIAARAGAKRLLDFRGRFSVTEKGPRDLVTEADLASQKAVQSVLLDRFPSHVFMGEEDGYDQVPPEIKSGEASHLWIVDPLDGTTNYVHGLAGYGVSIALFHSGKVRVGVVHDVVTGDTYWAIRDFGAFKNDVPISCSDTRQLHDALLACSFSTQVTRDGEEFGRFANVLGKASAIRRLGSAALNMCYVADGGLDGYFATSVKTWDIAAGLVIAKEAGASITGIDGGDFDLWNPKFSLGATESLQSELLASFTNSEAS